MADEVLTAKMRRVRAEFIEKHGEMMYHYEHQPDRAPFQAWVVYRNRPDGTRQLLAFEDDEFTAGNIAMLLELEMRRHRGEAV